MFLGISLYLLYKLVLGGRLKFSKLAFNFPRQSMLFLAVSLFFLYGFGNNNDATPAINPAVIKSTNNFGFAVFTDLYKQQTSQNIFISPLSISMALSMLYNGAAGSTQQAMANTLGMQDIDITTLNETNLALRNSLQNLTPDIQFSLANSLWVAAGAKLKTGFLDRNQHFYNAKIATVDFSSPATLTTINKWVSDNTMGKIPTMLSALNKQTSLALLNAIYFKGQWHQPFDKSSTQQKTFYLATGKKIEIPMMAQSGNYFYLENNDFQAVKLPYGKQQQASMYIFLPKNHSGLKQLIKQLTNDHWQQWFSQFHFAPGGIQLPRFTMSYDTSLVDTLRKLGMANAFDPAHADFLEVAADRKLFISDVIHKSYVEVNEEGTEAAAATAVVLVGAVREPQPEKRFSFIADHPFFYAIVDNNTSAILFMGEISQPQS